MSDKKVSVFDAFGTNTDEERDGVWRDFYGSNGVHVRVRIARMGGSNVAFRKTLERLSKPYRKGSLDGTPNIPPEVDTKLFNRAMAETIVKDWQGVYDGEGNDLACSVENVELVLNKASILAEFVAQEARNLDNFAVKVNEEIEKN